MCSHKISINGIVKNIKHYVIFYQLSCSIATASPRHFGKLICSMLLQISIYEHCFGCSNSTQKTSPVYIIHCIYIVVIILVFQSLDIYSIHTLAKKKKLIQPLTCSNIQGPILLFKTAPPSLNMVAILLSCCIHTYIKSHHFGYMKLSLDIHSVLLCSPCRDLMTTLSLPRMQSDL